MVASLRIPENRSHASVNCACAAATAKADNVAAQLPEAPEPHVTKGYCAWGYGEQDRAKAGAEFAAAAERVRAELK